MARLFIGLVAWFCSYQNLWILDESDLKLARKGRQTGFTYAASYRVVRKCLQIAGLDWWWISRDETFGKEFVRYVRGWCEVANIVAKALEFKTPNRKGVHRVQGNNSWMDLGRDVMVMEVRFPNGSRLHVLTSSPHAAAGKSGFVTIDEFDLHKKQKELYNVVMPITTWGGSLEIISTHEGGKASTFMTFIRDILEKGNPMGWSYHKVNIKDAVAAGLVDRINRRRKQYHKKPLSPEQFLADCRRKCESEEAWLEKYMCEPADDKRALIPWDAILRAERPWADLRVDRTTGPTFLGMDIGRRRDLSIIWTGERLATLHTRDIWESEDGMDYDDYEAALEQAVDRWKPRRLAIDMSTKGEMLCEHAQKKWGEDRVIGVNMASKPTQMTVATGIEMAFNRNAIAIPRDEGIRRDIYAVQKIVGEGGVIKYWAPTHPDGHSDRCWALALMIHAAREEEGPAMAARLGEDQDRRVAAVGQPFLTAEEEDFQDARNLNDSYRGF